MGFIRGIGMPELLIILAIILLVFGTARLPKLAGSMGKAIREFRRTASNSSTPSSATRTKSTTRPRRRTSKK